MKERDIEFDSHMSGFVYKVRVNGEVLIKKEIPGPDTVDEFLYEINALNRLKHSNSVIKFYGVIVDDRGEYVKGLLISFAEQGALIDVIYDSERSLPWPTREKWARQIVQGLSEIHEAGFVQGDFTLSNIVIDGDDDAKIIDINRRGCPVGWEPPEATPLIENNQRISMYIGVKSDLYQLGMVLWALATQDDEPEAQGRPLRIGPDALVPIWYRKVVDICLSEDPRNRLQALQLLAMMPEPEVHDPAKHDPQCSHPSLPSISVDDDISGHEYLVDGYYSPTYPWTSPMHPPNDWSHVSWGHSHGNPTAGIPDDPYFYPTRGRSPPSPLPSNHGGCQGPRYGARWPTSYENSQVAPSVDDSIPDRAEDGCRSATPRTSGESIPAGDNLIGLKQAGGLGVVDSAEAQMVEDITTTNLEPATEDVVVNGVSRLGGSDAGAGQPSDSSNTPVQEPGKPVDDVTEVHLDGESEAVNEHTLTVDEHTVAVPAPDSPELGKTEPDQQPDQSSKEHEPPHETYMDPDPAILPPTTELHTKIGEDVRTENSGARTSPEPLGFGGHIEPKKGTPPKQDIEPAWETEINTRDNDEIREDANNKTEELVSTWNGSPIGMPATPPPSDSKLIAIRDGMADDLKGVGTGCDRASVWLQDLITDDDLQSLQSKDTALNSTMTSSTTIMTTTDDHAKTRQQS